MKPNFDIAMLVAGLPFDGNTLRTRSLGGSESAGLYMAKALGKLGHHVKVFCNTPEPSHDEEGVEYYPIALWSQYARNVPHDVTIVQRMPEAFSTRYNSKLNFAWQHDLAQGRTSQGIKGAMWNIDRIMVLSDYMLGQYMDATGLPQEAFYQTRNGIDLALFKRLREEKLERNPNRLIYTARPERGLDVLLGEVMPRLLQKNPKLELYIAGYENPVEDFKEFYAYCAQQAKNLGCVKNLGPLTKEQLYREYMQAGVYVYPTPSPVMPKFAEVSCITAMECQAAGLPIVTSLHGALPETIAQGAGRLIGRVDGYLDQFCNAVLTLTGDSVEWSKASEAGLQAAERLDWSDVAKEWTDEFERLIRAHNDNLGRLGRHFWRQSDIVAAKKIADEDDNPDLQALLEPFDFAFKGPEGFREQYAKIGTTHGPDAHLYGQNEPRLQEMIKWLQAHDDVQNVLDYGCGLGVYAGWGAKHTGKRFLGVDIDPATVKYARDTAAKIGVTHRVDFAVGEHDDLPLRDKSFDCAVMQEVLEHVSEPWEVIQNIEKKVVKDGWVYITVPYGPWEFSSYFTYPHRAHIWHFDQHDLRDMLGKKPGLAITSLYYGDSNELGDSLGWWIVTYRADHEPIGKIDMQRKLWLQRPRQTVSASMIVGGAQAEECLHWCLKSYEQIVDEIVIVDTGMTEEARRIALQHGAKVFEGPNPLVEGFEVGRNFGLDRCRMDFVFWIDADEKLIGGRSVNKYLRENMFNGYGMRQHHFACDTQFDPDMPVRIFRNREKNGKQMRFYGAIHEHPELALNAGPGTVVVLSDVHIAHVGYLIEDIRKRRFARNYPLLKLDTERYPDRLLQKHFLMRDKMVLVKEALNANGNRIDEGIRQMCREVVKLYQDHFLGKGHYMNADSLQYYSEALTVLGEGFEAAFEVAADPVEAKPQKMNRYRFASQNDFMTELTWRAKETTGKFSQEHY